MKYIDQTSNQLRLYLSDGAADVSAFTIISEAHVETNTCKIHYGILTESHFVIIEHNHCILNEVLACSEIALNRADTYGIEDMLKKSFQRSCNDTSVYEFKLSVLDSNAAIHELHALREKRSEENTHYLEHTFPTSSADEFPAVTEVYVSTTEKDILVQTVHTYPNEEKVIMSRSVFTCIK